MPDSIYRIPQGRPYRLEAERQKCHHNGEIQGKGIDTDICPVGKVLAPFAYIENYLRTDRLSNKKSKD